jgi:hypothetical protein
MALIDYKGYRLIALSLLPVSPVTIRYGMPCFIIRIGNKLIYLLMYSGSCNSGLLVHRDIPELSALMDRASTLLNLKSHVVGNTHATSQVTISSPSFPSPTLSRKSSALVDIPFSCAKKICRF